MKSLLVSRYYFPPRKGGISHFMDGIASALGPDRVCCLTAVPGSDGRKGRYPRVYRRAAAFEGRKPQQAMRLGVTLAEILVRDRPRVVQLAMTSDAIVGLALHRLLGLPFLLYAHGNEILAAGQEPWRKPRLALARAHRVLANSRFTAGLVQQLGVSSDRIEVVYPGCDPERFAPQQSSPAVRERILGTRHGDRVLLTVGGLVPRKGHDIVIRAMARLRTRHPDVTYLIVGDGPHRTALEELSRVSGVRDRVVFAGQLSTVDLPTVYSVADVFVMPSRADLAGCDVEGFGLVFLEAGACGKPVVGGRSGGIPEAIVEGETGFLVDATDPEALAATLDRLLADQALARRLGEQGRERVLRQFTWSRVGEQVARIADEAATHRIWQRKATDK